MTKNPLDDITVPMAKGLFAHVRNDKRFVFWIQYSNALHLFRRVALAISGKLTTHSIFKGQKALELNLSSALMFLFEFYAITNHKTFLTTELTMIKPQIIYKIITWK